MKFKTDNNYTVFFKDGTSLKSNGGAESIVKNTVANEFMWVAYHIDKEVRLAVKTHDDIKKIEYTLEFDDNNI